MPSLTRWASKASKCLALSSKCSSLIPGELECLYMYPCKVLSQSSCPWIELYDRQLDYEKDG